MSEPQTRSAAVQCISRITLTVADLAGTSRFYERALGFRIVGRRMQSSPAAQAIVLGLGAEEIELIQFDAPGAPYPAQRTASDPWFQHFAIVVSDMPAACARLCAEGGGQPISQGGPQLLPPSTGSVTAYKFRDPEGHPLELSFFPPGVGDPRWQARDRLFLGVDHSGIAVTDLDASVRFYRDLLGFAAAPVLVNSGPTQARLDGLPDPVVDIVPVSPPAGPHIELLAYRGAAPSAAPPPRVGDIAATQLDLATLGVEAIVQRAASFGGTVERPGTADALIRDPAGHLLRLVESGGG
ncbi:VOC family protein [Phenylobacterium sp.]|uniref:VOC family protein n=1 Tax=Phenylobacterium sp. TaxID=1871053 RepID=UPI001208A5CD|nr:VOC family protein [Phenylobacterium sp.]THD61276.1 MAG: glyoxalase [Phenylobacterium sp.]